MSKEQKITIKRVPVDPNEEYNCVVTLTKECNAILLPTLREMFEVELLQGENSVLLDGRIEHKFNCYDDYKISILQNALMKTYRTAGGENDITTNNN